MPSFYEDLSDMYQKGYKEGKTQSIEVLARVLESVKFKSDTPTATIMNLIFDEIYQKVLDELT